ncbi:MAG: hypothetical protein ABIZ04_16115 [Opitutus sp.]
MATTVGQAAFASTTSSYRKRGIVLGSASAALEFPQLGGWDGGRGVVRSHAQAFYTFL